MTSLPFWFSQYQIKKLSPIIKLIFHVEGFESTRTDTVRKAGREAIIEMESALAAVENNIRITQPSKQNNLVK